MRFDLHIHTELSPCSTLNLSDILREGRRRGLDGVCITDHGTTGVRHHVVEGMQDDGLCVLIGTEYDTPDGDFLLFGPLLEPPPGLPARDVLRQVERAGGVAVAAHPCRGDRPVEEALLREGWCRVVELLNGRSTPSENRGVQQLLTRYPLVGCGGSDAHSLGELGRVVTRFDVPVRSQEDLVRALVGGLCRPARTRRSRLLGPPSGEVPLHPPLGRAGPVFGRADGGCPCRASAC